MNKTKILKIIILSVILTSIIVMFVYAEQNPNVIFNSCQNETSMLKSCL